MGMALPASILEAKGMGRERRVRGFLFGDSKHGRRGGTGLAPNSHYYHIGSSRGALFRRGKGRARVGAGRGGYGVAYNSLNQARDSRRKGIDARAEAWSGASMVAGRAPLIPGGLAGE